MVAVITALLLVTAWVAAGDRSLPHLTAQQHATSVAVPQHSGETLVSVDVTRAVIVSVPAGSRVAEPRLGPVWALAALAAALAALAALRRRPDGSGIAARPIRRRGCVSSRAPPLASFA
jgi:hypothetical protein